jgi:hypothetical protein
VIEVPDGVESVPAIDPRGRNVIRIVRRWGFDRALWQGKTERSAGNRAIAEARALAERLNAEVLAKSLAPAVNRLFATPETSCDDLVPAIVRALLADTEPDPDALFDAIRAEALS